MQRQKALLISTLAILLVVPMACGPKCLDLKTAMSEEDLAKDDANRINELVDRRKSLIEGGKGTTDGFALERMKFSVTAYELAIQIQVRIVNLAEDSEQYAQNIATINDTRCLLDEVITNKTNIISDRVGKEIHNKHTTFEKLFANVGRPSKYDLKDVYEHGVVTDEGITKDTDAKKEESEDAFSDEEEKEDGKDKSEGEKEPTKKEKKVPTKKEKKSDELDLFG